MSERKKTVHIWVELKNNAYLANEYVGWFNEDLSEGNITSATLEDSYIFFSYSKFWIEQAIERTKACELNPSDMSYILLLFDENYRKDVPIGRMTQFPTVVYLGWIEFALPDLPKLVPIGVSPEAISEGQISFYGKKYDKNASYIRLAYEKVKSLKELQIFPHLKSIHLVQHNLEVQMDKLDYLDKFSELETLYLFGTIISKIEHLEKLQNLKRLGINDAHIETIENLKQLINLIELSLSTNQIKKIEGLDGLIKLQKLNLAENKIEKIENLSPLGHLLEIDLHSNYIRAIENLNLLSLLESLNLSSNLIAKISGIDYLTNLKGVNLYNNQISKIENLTHLKNVEKLLLGFNQIKKIENLTDLNKLNWLDLNHNEIENIENLDQLPKLEHINLSENKIRRLQNLEKLPSLKDLIIWGNPIEEITQTTYNALANNHNIKLGMLEPEKIGLMRFKDKYKVKIIES